MIAFLVCCALVLGVLDQAASHAKQLDYENRVQLAAQCIAAIPPILVPADFLREAAKRHECESRFLRREI